MFELKDEKGSVGLEGSHVRTDFKAFRNFGCNFSFVMAEFAWTVDTKFFLIINLAKDNLLHTFQIQLCTSYFRKLQYLCRHLPADFRLCD